jgi:hypothetical protein
MTPFKNILKETGPSLQVICNGTVIKYTSFVKYLGANLDQILLASPFDSLHQCFSCCLLSKSFMQFHYNEILSFKGTLQNTKGQGCFNSILKITTKDFDCLKRYKNHPRAWKKVIQY